MSYLSRKAPEIPERRKISKFGLLPASSLGEKWRTADIQKTLNPKKAYYFALNVIYTHQKHVSQTILHKVRPKFENIFCIIWLQCYFHIFTKIWTLPCPLCTCAQWAWGGRGTRNFFFKVGNRPQEAMQKKILEFSPPISDICLYCHFCQQLNLPFSELNITPSVRPNLGIFKDFQYWISIFRQSSWVKKNQFELNLTSFKWASPRSALTGLPRLGWDHPTSICALTTFTPFRHFEWRFTIKWFFYVTSI